MKIQVKVYTVWENPRWGPLEVGYDLIEVEEAQSILHEMKKINQRRAAL